MSRKRKAPIRKVYPIKISFGGCFEVYKFNYVRWKRSTAEKILYDALEKIKSKNKEDPQKFSIQL